MAIERIEHVEHVERDEVMKGRGGAPRRADVVAGDESGAELRGVAVRLMSRAAEEVGDDPERAEWLLDRAQRAMIQLWIVERSAEPVRGPAEQDGIERQDPHLARQLRLARQAGDQRERLRHCRAALVLIERVEVGLEPADAGCGVRRVEASRAVVIEAVQSADDRER